MEYGLISIIALNPNLIKGLQCILFWVLYFPCIDFVFSKYYGTWLHRFCFSHNFFLRTMWCEILSPTVTW